MIVTGLGLNVFQVTPIAVILQLPPSTQYYPAQTLHDIIQASMSEKYR